jgi:hypothetical protein
MEHEVSIPLSQELSTCSYPEPEQRSPHHPIPHLSKIYPTYTKLQPKLLFAYILACKFQALQKRQFTAATLIEDWPPTVVSRAGSYTAYRQDLLTRCNLVDASMVQWSELLATDPEVPGSIPGATRISEK